MRSSSQLNRIAMAFGLNSIQLSIPSSVGNPTEMLDSITLINS